MQNVPGFDGHLRSQEWMHRPATLAVFKALTEKGGEARFVGGCVRNAIIGLPITDIDIATPIPPAEVITLLRSQGIDAIPTGIAHGTITAICQHQPFEITTLRQDIETYGRHARVAFTDNWQADAARRDLTINALFASIDGEVYDYFDGVSDLMAGRIRFVGTARQRIEEDILRLLRYFRFHAWFGRLPPDAQTLDAIGAFVPALPRLSKERIHTEIFKLLQAPDPTLALQYMADLDIFQMILPEAKNISLLNKLKTIEQEVGIRSPSPLCRLAALLRGGIETVAAATRLLRLSNKERAHLTALKEDENPPIDANLPPLAMKTLLYRRGKDIALSKILLAWAEASGREGATPTQSEAWKRLYRLASHWVIPTFPLSGQDLLARGVPPGPNLGRLLQAVEEWWKAGGFVADHTGCLAELQKRL